MTPVFFSLLRSLLHFGMVNGPTLRFHVVRQHVVRVQCVWPGIKAAGAIGFRTSCKFTPETVSPHVGVYLTSISSPGPSSSYAWAMLWPGAVLSAIFAETSVANSESLRTYVCVRPKAVSLAWETSPSRWASGRTCCWSPHVGVYLTSISSPGPSSSYAWAMLWPGAVLSAIFAEASVANSESLRTYVCVRHKAVPLAWETSPSRWASGRTCCWRLPDDPFPHGSPGVLCRFTSASHRISGWVVSAADTARHFRGPGFRPVRGNTELVAPPVAVGLNDGGVLEVHERAAVLPGTLQVPAQGFATLLRYPARGLPTTQPPGGSSTSSFAQAPAADGCVARSHPRPESPCRISGPKNAQGVCWSRALNPLAVPCGPWLR